VIDRLLAPAPDPARVGWLALPDYAHRGLHGLGVAENSPAAFRAAIAVGMGIECDVQRSSDGQAMVFHDWELDRLTAQQGPVAARDAAALGKIRLAGGADCIPTLRATLAFVNGRAPILIEIKSKRGYDVAVSCAAVKRELETYAGPHGVMSFDPRVGRWFARHSPQTVRGLVMTEENDRGFSGTLRRKLWLWTARPDFLAYDIRDLPSDFAAAQRARGLPLLTWTVRTAGLRERARQFADAPIAEGEGVF
jgi:glycerophosphoryl diester phosphodiesterase